MKQDTRPDCAVRIAAAKHRVRRVRSNRRCRQRWDGSWPGEADCERLGFFVNGDRSLPDINRLFAECVWNAHRQRWERLLLGMKRRSDAKRSRHRAPSHPRGSLLPRSNSSRDFLTPH
jgi:hypothetical protein